jgi:DNA-3-methyladenine glycosylase
VYFIYGFWNCLNVVTGERGTPQAVLLRALEPLAAVSGRTSGPGLLCRALGIDRRLNGADLLGNVLWLECAPRAAPRPRIVRAPRIGVAYAGAWALKPWRFYDAASPCVSTLTAAARRQLLSLQDREAPHSH